MDLFETQNHKNSSSLKMMKHMSKRRLNQDQVSLLERSFSFDKKLEPERKHQLADQLGIPPRQVAIWYQNKRARWRTQSLELDCSALQLKLDTALAEKRQLESEVEWLRGELEKARQALFAVDGRCQKTRPLSTSTTVCSISSYCGEQEGGSSSSFCDHHDQYHQHVMDDDDDDDDQVLQMDHELFASFLDW